MKKLISIICITGLFLSVLLTQAGCSSGKAQVYYLNFKPESASIYEEIAREYEKETGVRIKVLTAAAGTYEQTLKSEIAKKNAPTIFQVNGQVGFSDWREYCTDLGDTELYRILSDKTLAITEGSGVYAIPYAIEGYGIIYNSAITDKYFTLDNRQKSINSMDEIKSFAALRTVVEDMSAHKTELDILGVFASTSLSSGEDWRWQTHLMNLPLYYEFKENTSFEDPTLAGLNTVDISFKYAENFKNIFDLYLNNSVTEKGLLGSKSVADSMAEFATGRAAMVQNGNWAWSQIAEVAGNTVDSRSIKFLPIYTGIEGEESQGLCIGTENYLAINSKVSPESQKASVDFLVWLFSSSTGKKFVTEKLGFITPFNTFTEAEQPSDPLALELTDYMNRQSVNSVPWIFTSFPSESFKTEYGNLLLEYVQGEKNFTDVSKGAIQLWKTQR